MKNLLIFCLLLVIYSCNTPKQTIVADKQESFIDSTLVIKDTIQYQQVDTVLKLEYIKSEIREEIKPDPIKREVNQEKEIKKNNNKNVKIEDKTKSDIIPDVIEQTGTMAYTVPSEMQVGKTYPIRLRISKTKNKIELIEGDRNITIYDSTIKSKVIIESIRVESIMSAQLIGDSDKFQITALSTELQNIEENGYTEWEWRIKPLKGGQTYLKLIVKVRVKEDGQEFYKDITVFDKNVDVKSNIGFSLWSFIQKYWQWIVTTIIIPLVIWWWKNRKTEKKPGRKKNV
jgi:hypothetical protein